MSLHKTHAVPLFLACLLACLLSAGCPLTNSTLELVHKPVFSKPISSAPHEFVIGRVLDSRADKTRIGCKKTGIGSEAADLLSPRPVAEWLGDVLRDELVRAGLRQASSGTTNAVRIDVELLDFFCEPDVGLSYDLFAIINTEVRVFLPGGEGFARRFSATEHRSYLTQLDGNYEQVLGLALERWVAQVVPAVIQLIESRTGEGGPPASG